MTIRRVILARLNSADHFGGSVLLLVDSALAYLIVKVDRISTKWHQAGYKLRGPSETIIHLEFFKDVFFLGSVFLKFVKFENSVFRRQEFQRCKHRVKGGYFKLYYLLPKLCRHKDVKTFSKNQKKLNIFIFNVKIPRR